MSKELTETTGNGFDLRPKDMDEAMKIATMVANSMLAPKDFRGKPEDTLVAMMLGNELGLNPMQSIQNIAVINGRPSIWGDALLALVQNHPKFESIEESIDEATMTASCTVKRKGGKKQTSTFSQSDASIANLWGKQGPWTQYPKRMLQMRARGFALRDQFSDALSGLITREEAMDLPDVELADITDTSTVEKVSPGNSDQSAPEAELMNEYGQAEFEKNLPAWIKMVKDSEGKRTIEDVILKVQTKGTLSDKQKSEMRSYF
jgi:hypothetical protein